MRLLREGELPCVPSVVPYQARCLFPLSRAPKPCCALDHFTHGLPYAGEGLCSSDTMAEPKGSNPPSTREFSPSRLNQIRQKRDDAGDGAINVRKQVAPGLKGARPEPTGDDYAVANFIPLPIPLKYPLSQAPNRPVTGRSNSSCH